MKIKIVLLGALMMLITGCSGLLGPDKEGWRYSQKSQFLTILKSDKYMSLCNQKRLYAKVKKSRDSKLMTKLFLAYVNNLANSCIDLNSFKASQRAKKSNEIDTHYSLPMQKIDKKSIMNSLKGGATIEAILKPYVPTTREFKALTSKYRTLKRSGEGSASLLKKIRLNIERTKLLPEKLGANHVMMNIPAFKVTLFENGKKNLEFRTVVGKTNMQTPVFSADLQYIMVNPQWNVPDSIARKSIIPRYLRGGNGYLAAKGMEIHRSFDLRSPKVNGASVDWSKYPKEGKGFIPYKFIQKPSLKNGLGRVKFMFPNHFAVYMHDTQSKSLFKKSYRCYSHGCIRLEKPMTLLRYLTEHYTSQTMDTVLDYYDSKKSHMLRINKSLPVHVVYLTAYVDTEGKLHTYNDVYGFDKSQRVKR